MILIKEIRASSILLSLNHYFPAIIDVNTFGYGFAVTSHHTTGIGAGGIDSACGAQVLDSGTVGIAERPAEFSIGGIVDGKGIAAAVESALECIESTPTRTSTHHAADADVFRHQEICTTVALT